MGIARASQPEARGTWKEWARARWRNVLAMATYVLRLWLPDRPGVLGAVASRVGAVGGDVIGIDIIERGEGRAIDELVIELADEDWIGLLLTEIAEVDGVHIEQVTAVDGTLNDPRLDALETAAELMGALTHPEAIESLCRHAIRQLSAGWGAVVSFDGRSVVASSGERIPDADWLLALVEVRQGNAEVEPVGGEPVDVVCAPLPEANLTIVLGREGIRFRAREQRQAAALARIVDIRFRDLSEEETEAPKSGDRDAQASESPGAQARARSTARSH